MKKVFNYIFEKQQTIDYVFCLLALLTLPAVAAVFNLNALSAITGIVMVFAATNVYKNYSLGYGLAIAAIGLYAYQLYTYGLTGNMLILAGIIAPVLIYKIVALHVAKVGEPSKLSKWDYIIYGAIILLTAYPFYLLMISMNSYMPILEAIDLSVALVAAFLLVRGYNFAKYLLIPIFISQLVVIILQMVDIDITRACVMLGLLITIVYQSIKFFGELGERYKVYRQSHPKAEKPKAEKKEKTTKKAKVKAEKNA